MNPKPNTPESTVPKGFTYYGVGPLKVQADRSPDVALYSDGWNAGRSGDDAQFHYAIRSSTPLAWQNGLDLPTLPKGYSHWEYRGVGWTAKNVTYATGFENKAGEFKWSQINPYRTTYGDSSRHYIEAIPIPQINAIHLNTPLAWQNSLDLPPVPEGYSHWEYRGMAWKSEGPCIYACRGTHPKARWDDVNRKPQKTSAVEGVYYIEAIPIQAPCVDANPAKQPCLVNKIQKLQTELNSALARAKKAEAVLDAQITANKLFHFYQSDYYS